MALSYRPLWIELAKRELMRTEFQKMAGISSNILAKMGNDQPISMMNLEKICLALDINPCQVIEFKKDDEESVVNG